MSAVNQSNMFLTVNNDITMSDMKVSPLVSTNASPSNQDHSHMVSPCPSSYDPNEHYDNVSESEEFEEFETFQENPQQEAQYMQWLAEEDELFKSHQQTASQVLSYLQQKLPEIVIAPNGTKSWVEVCGSHKQGTMLSSSNLDVMCVFEHNEVLPTQTIVDKLTDVTKAVQAGQLEGFTIKTMAKFQKQFRLKHIVLSFQGNLDVSVQIECRLAGQPQKTPGRACGDEAINRVLNLDETGKCRDFVRLMKIWARKNNLHGSIRMFNSAVEVLLAMHTCQRLFLLPPLEAAKTDNITWTKPAEAENPSFCRFFHEFRNMILVFAQEVVQKEAFNMYVHFSAWKGAVTLDEATDKNHPPCEGRFRLYMENPAIHFIETEDAGIPAPTGNMAREITNGAWIRLLELCGAPAEFMAPPVISPEEAAALRPQENRIITPEEGKRLGKKRRKKARVEKVKELRRAVQDGELPIEALPVTKPRKRALTQSNSYQNLGAVGRRMRPMDMTPPMYNTSPLGGFNMMPQQQMGSPNMQPMMQPMMQPLDSSCSPGFNQQFNGQFTPSTMTPQQWTPLNTGMQTPQSNGMYSCGTPNNGFMTPPAFSSPIFTPTQCNSPPNGQNFTSSPNELSPGQQQQQFQQFVPVMFTNQSPQMMADQNYNFDMNMDMDVNNPSKRQRMGSQPNMFAVCNGFNQFASNSPNSAFVNNAQPLVTPAPMANNTGFGTY